MELMVSIKEIHCSDSFEIGDDILLSDEPIILRNLVAHWPVVAQAKRSNADVVNYFNTLYSGLPQTVVQGESDIKTRVGYTPDLLKLNCISSMKSLPEALDLMLSNNNVETDTLYYIGTAATQSIMPEFRQHNDINFGFKANQYIWMGNRSCISTHYDLPDNIACNIVGRRRFTLFPPDQLENLYVGPLDFTPAGQAISLVDVRNPDLERFPKFSDAQQVVLVAELDAGDALFLPSMWWHNVEGLEDLNVLVNYWWRRTPGYMNSPADVLDLALLSIRDLPPAQKKIWKNLLDYYVFNDDVSEGEGAFDHIPEARRGSVGLMNDTVARKIRAKILARLNR
jgi:hypothetical protein